MPIAIALLILLLMVLSLGVENDVVSSLYLVSVSATQEITFGGIDVHHPKVGCSGESAIYPKSYDRRGPESAAGLSAVGAGWSYGLSPKWWR
jgi:hypothetical protein